MYVCVCSVYVCMSMLSVCMCVCARWCICVVCVCVCCVRVSMSVCMCVCVVHVCMSARMCLCVMHRCACVVCACTCVHVNNLCHRALLPLRQLHSVFRAQQAGCRVEVKAAHLPRSKGEAGSAHCSCQWSWPPLLSTPLVHQWRQAS